jgi:hypothetical protein
LACIEGAALNKVIITAIKQKSFRPIIIPPSTKNRLPDPGRRWRSDVNPNLFLLHINPSRHPNETVNDREKQNSPESGGACRAEAVQMVSWDSWDEEQIYSAREVLQGLYRRRDIDIYTIVSNVYIN